MSDNCISQHHDGDDDQERYMQPNKNKVSQKIGNLLVWYPIHWVGRSHTTIQYKVSL